MTPLCLENAHSVLQITKHFAPDPDITQSPNDTLMVDWDASRMFVLLEVGDKEYSVVFWNNEGNEYYQGAFSYELITLLKKALTTLYPEYK